MAKHLAEKKPICAYILGSAKAYLIVLSLQDVHTCVG